MDTDRTDSHLTEAVNACTAGHVVEWSQVAEEMRARGHHSVREDQCLKRMNQLVDRYFDVLINCQSDYRRTCSQWPLFANLNDMNLRPFVNYNAFITIEYLRSRMANNLAEPVMKTSGDESVVIKQKTSDPKTSMSPIDVTNSLNVKPMVKTVEDKSISKKIIAFKALDTNSKSMTNPSDSKQTHEEHKVLDSSPPLKIYNRSLFFTDNKTDSALITERMANSSESQSTITKSEKSSAERPPKGFKCLVDFEGNKFFVTIDSLNTEYLIFGRITGQIEEAIGSRISNNTHAFEVRLLEIVL